MNISKLFLIFLIGTASCFGSFWSYSKYVNPFFYWKIGKIGFKAIKLQKLEKTIEKELKEDMEYKNLEINEKLKEENIKTKENEIKSAKNDIKTLKEKGLDELLGIQNPFEERTIQYNFKDEKWQFSTNLEYRQSYFQKWKDAALKNLDNIISQLTEDIRFDKSRQKEIISEKLKIYESQKKRDKQTQQKVATYYKLKEEIILLIQKIAKTYSDRQIELSDQEIEIILGDIERVINRTINKNKSKLEYNPVNIRY